ncbi:long-chain-fatty-acid--CoA ligase [Rhodococcus sp. BE178]|uniref:long-chain-fatty-acid--CoA ligase n=1 Tax=Rhodococcus sp. BE178 TaxID=2817737 RepID=UPI003D24228D
MDRHDELAGARRQHWVNYTARHALHRSDHAALKFGERTISWASLQERVVALSDALARRGVGHGDRVALLMGNRPELIETLLATNRLGAIAVPLNTRLTAPEATYILDDSGASVLFVDDGTAALGHAASAGSDHSVQLVLVPEPDSPVVDSGLSYSDLLSEEGPSAPAIDVDEDDPALIMYTSGTTGRPKGAVLTHRNLSAQSAIVLTAFRFEVGDEVNLCASPLFHIAAIATVAPSIMIGATIVILPTGSFDAAMVLDLVERERVTSTFLVPTQWQAICEEQEQRPRNLSSLRVSGWGGAPATDALLRRMNANLPGASSLALFGQTEMSAVTCLLEGTDALRKLGSVGKPAPTVWARVVDAEMNDVTPGEVGEIVYRGPGMMLDYWNNPDATAQAFAGGWFHSGDLVRIDDEGFVYVVDRLKDMIISGGENIYCAEVENALANHPAIADVSVIGRSHDHWGEAPVAVVVLREGSSELTIEALRASAGSDLAGYKLPRALEIVDTLPRNASGKVDKNALRVRFGGKEPQVLR